MSRSPQALQQTRTVRDALVLHRRGRRYGYDLTNETGLESTTLYPRLIRLSDQGLLEAEWRPCIAPERE